MKQLTKSLSYILTISLLAFLIPTNTVDAATPTYIYEWMSQSGTISSDLLAHEYTNLEAGQTIDLSLTLINRSNNTIRSRNSLIQSPDLQVPIGSYGIGSQTPHQDGTPYFLDTSSFVLNNNRFAYYEGDDISPNEAISMSWNIKLANNLADGVYNLYVRPVSEYKAWTRQIKTGKLLPTTSSDIFWRLTVGEEYLTYTNDMYSFSIDYPNGWYWNATSEIRDIKCKIMEVAGARDDFLSESGCDRVLGLAHFSNSNEIYCAQFDCLNKTFEELIDNPKEYVFNDNFMSAMIYEWPEEEYNDLLDRERNAKVKMSTSDFIKVDGVDMHIYTWLGSEGNCNQKTAYWSHNGSYFFLQFFMSLSLSDSCIRPEQEGELFTHMVNSLEFF